MSKTAILFLLATLVAANVYAQPVMDGRLAGDEIIYGAALSTQNTRGRYGDSLFGDPINGGTGSEIDRIFATVSDGRLNVFVAGNLQPNFNKIEVFIDSIAGGSNTIVGPDMPPGVDSFCCGGLNSATGALQRMNGLTFDTGFEADYYLTFTNGYETLRPNLSGSLTFWALSAHYADLTTADGDPTETVRAGMQLAYNGLPNVLRSPGDYDRDGSVDGADLLNWQRSVDSSVASPGDGADANGTLVVDNGDYTIWQKNFAKNTTLAGSAFTPATLANGVSQALLGPALPSLSQGQLIDRNYALGPGGATDNTGAGAVARELAFALGEDPSEVGTNQSAHRDFNNSIDLRMGFNNSNKEGVTVTTNAGPFELTPGVDNPETVTTGLEFSLPLSQIGNPTGDVKLTIFIGNGGHTDISNQISGEGILDLKIGGAFYSAFPAAPLGTFNDYAGDQFVTVHQSPIVAASASVPEPASIWLAFVSLWGAKHRSRRLRS
jgi:hypothetical protein